mmetsp:Transcript_11380/g.28786  ORF Transcript_11380/g.28786 Transcript_11380/m.28786 type:complete len:93 (-) Transcript_11380:119-397(-)
MSASYSISVTYQLTAAPNGRFQIWLYIVKTSPDKKRAKTDDKAADLHDGEEELIWNSIVLPLRRPGDMASMIVAVKSSASKPSLFVLRRTAT